MVLYDNNTDNGYDKIEDIPNELKWLVSNDYKFPCLIATPMSEDDNQTLLAMISIVQGIALASETAFLSWFTVYIEDEYDGTILLATCLSAFGTFTTLCGTVFIRINLNKYQASRDMANANADANINTNVNTNKEESENERTRNNSNDVIYVNSKKQFFHIENRYDLRNFLVFWCIVGCVIRIILYFVIIPDNLFGYGLGSNSYQYTFWIYFLLDGFAVGINILTLTAMLAPILPHNLTGSIIS